MTRTPLKKRSGKKKLIDQIDALLLAELKAERGIRCEICGKKNVVVGLFHILPKGTYPGLRFNKENLLLAEWFPCHHDWHHDFYKAREIEKKIIELRGKDYQIEINELPRMKLTTKNLEELLLNLKNGGV